MIGRRAQLGIRDALNFSVRVAVKSTHTIERISVF